MTIYKIAQQSLFHYIMFHSS